MADYQSQKAISEWSEKELNEASIAASRIANSAPDVPSRDKNGNPTGRSTLVGTYTNSDGSVTAYGQSLGIQQMRSNNTQSNTPYSDAIANAVGLDPRELRAPASNDGGSRAVGAGTGDLY